MALVVLSCPHFHLKLYFLDCIVTAIISASAKKSIKIDEFFSTHFNIEDGKKKQHFGHIMFIISRKVEMQLKHIHKNSISAEYGERSVTECVPCFVKFLDGVFSLDNAPWFGSLKLTATNSRY